MRSFRKALAVLLSVLMVVLSFPLSAFALVNENNTDGRYSYDYDAEMHVYAMPYTSYNAYAWANKSGTPEKFYNVNDMKRSEIRADMDADDSEYSTVGYYDNIATFVLVFTLENVDDIVGYNFAMNYDPEYIEPAYHADDYLTYTLSGDDGTEANVGKCRMPLKTRLDYESDIGWNDAGSETYFHDQPFINIAGATVTSTQGSQEQTKISANRKTYYIDGSIIAVMGFNLRQDCDLADVIEVRVKESDCTITTVMGNTEKSLVMYGAYDLYGEPVPETKMIFPELGVVGPTTEPEEVTYTYKFANGESTTVTAAAGEAPVAPANTATTDWAPADAGNHTRTSYSWPEWQDGVTEYTEVATPETAACEMVEKEAQVDPTHTTPGKTAVMECSVCGYTTGGEEIPADADAHSYKPVETVESTCSTKGHIKYECECGDTYTETLDLDPSNHENVVTDPAVAAGCETTGLTEGSHCEACGTPIVEQEVIEALGHDYQVTSSTDATCCVEGTVSYECTRCHDTYTDEGALDPNNHADYGTKVEHAKEATRGEDGYTGDTVCNGCGATITKGEVIPALGVQITVTANELGSTTINGEATTGAAQKVAYAKDYTLAATANEGAEFVGWSVNGKIVSKNATYTTTAYADTTYVPVFAEADSEAFTVTFVDQFNKVVDTIDSTELASLEALPTAPAYMGYTFDSWSLTLDEVKALEEATVVTANYTKDDLSYTVTAPNCTITVDGQAYEDTATVGFDAKVTVAPKADTATSWTVNGATAAYGESYTFYVTADVNVAYTTEDVTAVPTITAVSAEQVESDDRYVRFLATRSVPEGYTLVESGFVYGKGMAEDDLVLENVGTVQGTADATVKLAKNSNTAGDGQFALTFGVANKDAVASARAYMIVKDAEGVATVYYADAQIFNYPQA